MILNRFKRFSTLKTQDWSHIKPIIKPTLTPNSAVATYYETTGAPQRNNWTREEISSIFNSPLIDLISYASKVHRDNHDGRSVQQ
ncbi:hypothetical protein HDU92_007446, partial [Lobulomyces angularis]